MYITKKLIESFVKDVKSIAKNCCCEKDEFEITIVPKLDGVTAWLHGKSSSYAEAVNKAKVLSEEWNNSKNILNRYKGYIEEDLPNREVCSFGQGEGTNCCHPSVTLEFKFKSHLMCIEDTLKDYYITRKQLFDNLVELLGTTVFSSFIIKDEGDFCSIGLYEHDYNKKVKDLKNEVFFTFDYGTKDIKCLKNINIGKKDISRLSRYMVDTLSEVNNFGVPINTIFIERESPVCEKVYFYSIGEECILWRDLVFLHYHTEGGILGFGRFKVF